MIHVYPVELEFELESSDSTKATRLATRFFFVLHALKTNEQRFEKRKKENRTVASRNDVSSLVSTLQNTPRLATFLLFSSLSKELHTPFSLS